MPVGLGLLRQLEEESASFDLEKNAPLGFVLVIFAGLATGIGASAVFVKRLVALASKRVLAAGIGVSAGVMLYVSFIEIFQKSLGAFTDDGMAESDAYLAATMCFFGGIVFMKLLGMAVHSLDNQGLAHAGCSHAPPTPEAGGGAPIDVHVQEGGGVAPSQPASEAAPKDEDAETHQKLERMGLNTALAIGLHNFPEGLATFVGTLADPAVGVTLAVAIAIHNVPEGLCVALPIYYAKGNRFRAFMWGILSGLSEPVGALVGYIIVKASGDDMKLLIYGILFGLVSGMMVAIVLIELLPTAHRYDPNDSVVNYSTFAGMVIMALSLVLFMY
mmetsp:Transcript_111310/g.237827  ORF Transcript_111310/g.237827 Transcript_111310/m.237827 type:complete len:331 (+) Transcript_111310:87-1079(+)